MLNLIIHNQSEDQKKAVDVIASENIRILEEAKTGENCYACLLYTSAEEMSSIIGQESRAVGITSAMSPVIDVSRDPRWGRTYETYGEDQYLISQMGIHYVRGMQNQGVSCIAKHFLGYAETQAGLNTATTRLNAVSYTHLQRCRMLYTYI